ncbi:hypothetical protein D9M69_261710 [compost metagenome]
MGAVLLQGLDALLLLQQLFLVADLLLQLLVAAAQGGQLAFLLCVPAALLVEFRLQAGHLGLGLGAGGGDLLQAIQPAHLPLQLLPAFAQGGFRFAGQQPVQLGLTGALGPAGGGQSLLGRGGCRFLRGALLLQTLDGIAQLRQLFLQGTELPGQTAALGELRLPAAQMLAQPCALRVAGQLFVQLLAFRMQSLMGSLPLRRQLRAVPAGAPQAGGDAFAGLLLTGAVVFQGGEVPLYALPRRLPGVVQRLQAGGRFAVCQPAQFRRGIGQRLARLLFFRLGLAFLLFGAGQVLAPAALGLQRLLASARLGFTLRQVPGFRFQRGTLLGAKQFDALGAGAQLVQRRPHLAGAFEHALGDEAVDFRAGQFLQQLGALIGAGFEEGGEPALGQQHGFGEALEIQAGEAFGLAQLVADLVGEDAPAAVLALDLAQLDLRRLQRALGLVAGAALAPEGAVAPALHFELNFGEAVGGVPGHQLVAALRQAVHARRAVVQGQADGIQQRGLARPGGTGDGEQAVVLERLGVEVDLPFALQRVEVLQAQAEDSHGRSSCRSATTCR